VKKVLPLFAVVAACAGGKSSERPASPVPEGGVQVEDALHGVAYQLPPGAGGWQVANDGNARVSSGVQVEIATFPLARQASPAACRDAARKRLAAIRQRNDEDDPQASGGAVHDIPAQADGPRDQTVGDAPTAIWLFTRGPASNPVRNRWAFYARGADCLLLQVAGPQGEAFADQVFESSARSLKVLPLSAERQREVDLLAGMGFLERREPAAALDRFESLTRRDPGFAKAHFGALMAGFEMGTDAYARALPHGEMALKSDHELTPEQRQLALRAVGVMQLAQNQVKGAADTLAELIVRAPDLAEAQYNYACALARLGDDRGAIDHLRAAIQLDGDLAAHAGSDEDLKSLRGIAAFQALLRPSSARSQ
jgi:tetratricopeptide (TPR) repeat protein